MQQTLKQEYLTQTENGATCISQKYFEQNTQTALTAMNYQLVTKNNFSNIKGYLNQILQSSSKISKVYACLLIIYFRDIEFGKGLRKPFLECLISLYQNGLQNFVCAIIPEIPTYGYYKDLCNLYLLANEFNYEDLKFAILDCYAKGLIYEAKKKVPYGLKNCGKFAPRQQKKFHIFATDLARYLYPQSKQPFKDYRLFISYIMQKYAQVTEILISAKRWDEIDPKYVPSLCFQRYKKIFLKDEKNDEKKKKLKQNYTNHINRALRQDEGFKINSKRLTVDVVVNQILNSYKMNEVEVLALEAQFLDIFNDVKKNCKLLKKCVAICDVSGSMQGTPMNVCLGLGIIINEISDRQSHNLMTFSRHPQWIQIGDGQTYREKLQSLKGANWCMNTDFEKALDLVSDLKREEIPEIVFVFSDMQFDCSTCEKWETTIEKIERIFYVKHKMTPKEIPTIVFWNLRATGNFVVEHNRKKVITIAGYNQSLVKSICQAPDIDYILNLTPFTFLLEVLDDKRYKKIKDIALKTIQ